MTVDFLFLVEHIRILRVAYKNSTSRDLLSPYF